MDFTEEEYALAEREGLRLDSILCVECPDPGLCAAERACVAAEEHTPVPGAEWDPVPA